MVEENIIRPPSRPKTIGVPEPPKKTATKEKSSTKADSSSFWKGAPEPATKTPEKKAGLFNKLFKGKNADVSIDELREALELPEKKPVSISRSFEKASSEPNEIAKLRKTIKTGKLDKLREAAKAKPIDAKKKTSPAIKKATKANKKVVMKKPLKVNIAKKKIVSAPQKKAVKKVPLKKKVAKKKVAVKKAIKKTQLKKKVAKKKVAVKKGAKKKIVKKHTTLKAPPNPFKELQAKNKKSIAALKTITPETKIRNLFTKQDGTIAKSLQDALKILEKTSAPTFARALTSKKELEAFLLSRIKHTDEKQAVKKFKAELDAYLTLLAKKGDDLYKKELAQLHKTIHQEEHARELTHRQEKEFRALKQRQLADLEAKEKEVRSKMATLETQEKLIQTKEKRLEQERLAMLAKVKEAQETKTAYEVRLAKLQNDERAYQKEKAALAAHIKKQEGILSQGTLSLKRLKAAQELEIKKESDRLRSLQAAYTQKLGELEKKTDLFEKHKQEHDASMRKREEQVRLSLAKEQEILDYIKEAEKKMDDMRKNIETVGFHKYIEKKLDEIDEVNPFGKQDKFTKQMEFKHSKFFTLIDACKKKIEEKNFDEAKKDYMAIKESFESTPFNKEERMMIYDAIRELYDDIRLGELSSSIPYA
ncbi:MAG: hypothetical protein H6502_03610 [Candidatus Woesearchaeota archaeon]|nr:MAG: hypothetical protein H6502_03610 [Candidatus Woesearchaeota archaeon]